MLAIGIIARLTLSNIFAIESTFNKLFINSNMPSVPAGSLPCNPPIKQVLINGDFWFPRNTMGISLPFCDFPIYLIDILSGKFAFKLSKKAIISSYLVNPFFLSNAGVGISMSKS